MIHYFCRTCTQLNERHFLPDHRFSRRFQSLALCKMELTSKDGFLGFLTWRLVNAVRSSVPASAVGGVAVTGHMSLRKFMQPMASFSVSTLERRFSYGSVRVCDRSPSKTSLMICIRLLSLVGWRPAAAAPVSTPTVRNKTLTERLYRAVFLNLCEIATR